MNKLLIALFICTLGSISGCSKAEETRAVVGYPIYKFLNFGGINQKALEKNKDTAKDILGESYESYLRQHALYVDHGFDRHIPLRIRMDSGDEVEIFIRDEDHDQLWMTSPHDLAKKKKSHRVTVKFVEVQVGDVIARRATSFQTSLIDKEPILEK
jgi:hypothetical protein